MTTDATAPEHFMDLDVLKNMYQDALRSGCTPEFADKYIIEAARSMVLAEAMTVSTGAGVIEGILTKAHISARNA